MSIGTVGMRVYIPPVDGETIKTPVGELAMVQPKPEVIGKFGIIISYDEIKIFGKTTKTPVIKLDNGEIIKGYECWWQPADGDN